MQEICKYLCSECYKNEICCNHQSGDKTNNPWHGRQSIPAQIFSQPTQGMGMLVFAPFLKGYRQTQSCENNVDSIPENMEIGTANQVLHIWSHRNHQAA